jgi:uncharacterized protein (DUF169 family)
MLSRSSYSVLNKFGFEAVPVAVKFSQESPLGIPEADHPMALCEMLKYAQGGNSFYAGVHHHNCDAGAYVLGQAKLAEPFLKGQYGAGLGVFADARAASQLYHHILTIAEGSVNYVALSPWSKFSFEPDLLVILANIEQSEIIFRALSYKTGEAWNSHYSSAIGCSWLFAYPHVKGEINFTTTGLGFGMKRRKLFQPGQQLISVPYNKLGSLLENLNEMPWVPEPYKENGQEYVNNLKKSLGLE